MTETLLIPERNYRHHLGAGAGGIGTDMIGYILAMMFLAASAISLRLKNIVWAINCFIAAGITALATWILERST